MLLYDRFNQSVYAGGSGCGCVAAVTYGYVKRLLDENKILLNGRVAKKSESLKIGDVLDIEIPDPKALSIEPQNIPLEIPYEDEHLLVVNKPKGMVVHPAAGNYDKTLVNALLGYLGENLSSDRSREISIIL